MNSYKNINNDSACFIIAEVGLNHNGDYQLAHDSIIAAAKAGVSAVKFQNFKTEDFLTDKSIMHTYKNGGKEISEPLFDICKRSEFKNEWIKPLMSLCEGLGVVFLSTPTSEEGVNELVNNGVDLIKNGSDYLTHIPLIKYMAKSGATIILSTGMAYQEDIDCAVNTVHKYSTIDNNLVLLHCTSSYPTTDANVNLNKMLALKERYSVPVGFSDHTEGWVAAVQAVTLGAKVIEKHFTLDRTLPGPDHWFSSNFDEMKELVTQVRAAECRLGISSLEPAASEMKMRAQWRLGIVWDRDLAVGDTISSNDIAIRKPAEGLLPKDIDLVIGKKVTRICKRGNSIFKDDISL